MIIKRSDYWYVVKVVATHVIGATAILATEYAWFSLVFVFFIILLVYKDKEARWFITSNKWPIATLLPLLLLGILVSVFNSYFLYITLILAAIVLISLYLFFAAEEAKKIFQLNKEQINNRDSHHSKKNKPAVR